MSTIIEARDVVKSFGQTPALRGASIAVRPGEIVAVMGPSGSGKSTLLHCLAGILPPDEGEVWFAGQRLDTLNETQRSELRRDRFGFVFQSGQLVPELTAEENVALPLLLGGTRRAAALAEARAWFGRLGLDGLGNRRSGELSGGQAQRVALARGMVARPQVLFADEPTGSLGTLTGDMRQHAVHHPLAFVVGQHELLGPVGQDAHALRAGIDHEVGAALLAFEVELAVPVEHGGRHGKDAAIDRFRRHGPSRPTPPAGRTIRR